MRLLPLLAIAMLCLAAPASAAAAPPVISFEGNLFTTQVTNALSPVAQFTVTDDDATVLVLSCQVDSGAAGPCSGDPTSHQMTNLGDGTKDGTHSITVQADDGLGGISTNSFEFTVDTHAPTLTLAAQQTTTSLATWSFSESLTAPVSAKCRIDGGTQSPCTSDSTQAMPLGVHDLEVTLTDGAGNPVTGSSEVTTDAADPNPDIVSGPASQSTTSSPSPVFGVAATDDAGVALLECRFDQDDFADCSDNDFSPPTPLADGPHTLQVRATDIAGHTASEFRTFKVDTTAPTLSFLAPGGAFLAFLGFETADAMSPPITSECRFDASPSFAPCSPPVDLSSLDEGQHVVRVRVTDAVGNQRTSDPYSFKIDRTLPELSITSFTASSDGATITFTGSDANPITFTCRIDAQEFGPCSGDGSHTVSGLAVGQHRIDVKVTDGSGRSRTEGRIFTVAAATSGGGTTTGGSTTGTTGTTGGSTTGTTPAPDTRAPLVTRVRRGSRLTVRCDEACSITVRVTKRGRTVKTIRRTLAAGKSVTVSLKPARRHFGDARRLKVGVVLTARDAAGNRRTLRSSATLAR